ncbi:MAG: ABC transporter permease, partial [candidate division Zixibacteria bacterium]|nr:ABC transporter permease [candidate division Zixibacteria bacterium]
MTTNSTQRLRFSDYFFLSPWVITLILFWLFPVVASLFLSFTDYRLLSGNYSFVGFDNFAQLFRDAAFTKA